MTCEKRNEPWLQMPCKETGNKWRVYGMGTVWDHAQEWQARWKLHYLQAAFVADSLTPQHDPARPDSGVPERDQQISAAD